LDGLRRHLLTHALCLYGLPSQQGKALNVFNCPVSRPRLAIRDAVDIRRPDTAPTPFVLAENNGSVASRKKRDSVAIFGITRHYPDATFRENEDAVRRTDIIHEPQDVLTFVLHPFIEGWEPIEFRECTIITEGIAYVNVAPFSLTIF
jgi:hypothetical protein